MMQLLLLAAGAYGFHKKFTPAMTLAEIAAERERLNGELERARNRANADERERRALPTNKPGLDMLKVVPPTATARSRAFSQKVRDDLAEAVDVIGDQISAFAGDVADLPSRVARNWS